MGKVRYSAKAAEKIRAACDYYANFDSRLRQQLLTAITGSLGRLAEHPNTGRPCLENLNYREKIIPFGGSHFVALYRIDEADGGVVIVALRHEREFGYDAESET